MYKKDKLPVRGYFLVITGTDAAVALSKSVTQTRVLVDWTWVVASIKAGRMLEPDELPSSEETFVKKNAQRGWKVHVCDLHESEALMWLQLASLLAVSLIPCYAIALCFCLIKEDPHVFSFMVQNSSKVKIWQNLSSATQGRPPSRSSPRTS